MNITLKPELQQRLNERVSNGNFESADAMVEQAITLLLDFGEEEMTGPELQETKAAIHEALDQADRGEGVSLEEFERDMRAKYGISR